MSTDTPDPETVREIARDCAADYLGDARDIAAHVMGHFGMGVPGDVYAWTDAVRADLRAAVVSWPDEQPQDELDGYAVRILDMLEADPDRFQESEEEDLFEHVDQEPENAITYDGHSTVEKYGRVADLARRVQVERDAIDRNIADLLSDENLDAHRISASIQAAIRELRARVAELEAHPWQVLHADQDERDGDVRAVARWLAADSEDVPLTEWGAARAEVRERFGPQITALEARDAKAGE